MNCTTDVEIFDGTHVLDGRAFERCRFANCTLILRGGTFTFKDCTFGAGIIVQFEKEAVRWASFFGTMLRHEGIGPSVAQAIYDSARPPKPTLN